MLGFPPNALPELALGRLTKTRRPVDETNVAAAEAIILEAALHFSVRHQALHESYLMAAIPRFSVRTILILGI